MGASTNDSHEIRSTLTIGWVSLGTTLLWDAVESKTAKLSGENEPILDYS